MPQVLKRVSRWLTKLLRGQVDQAVQAPVQYVDRSVQQPTQTNPSVSNSHVGLAAPIQDLARAGGGLTGSDREMARAVHPTGPPGPLAESAHYREVVRSTIRTMLRTSGALDQDGYGSVVAFLQWVRDNEVDGDTTSAEAWSLYCQFCTAAGGRPMRQHEFFRQLKLHCACERRRVRHDGVGERLRFYTFPARRQPPRPKKA